MKRTLVTYAVGRSEYRIMALAMMQSAREISATSIDRYVIFTDSTDWRLVPDWIELVKLENIHVGERKSNWAIKPVLMQHPTLANDTVLYVDADSTIYRDVIGKCFEWIENNSLLIYLNFTSPDEVWGGYNLKQIYEKSGFQDVRNLSLNAGIMGVKQDTVGKSFLTHYRELFEAQVLSKFFDDPLYIHNDEPYVGLAFQRAFQSTNHAVPDVAHPFTSDDYMITVGAPPSLFHKKPGPVIRVEWCDRDIIQPAIVHWVSRTQYMFYRRLLWKYMWRGKMLRPYCIDLMLNDLQVMAWRFKQAYRNRILSSARR